MDDQLHTRLEAMCPTMKLTLTRHKLPNPELWKEALRKPVPFTKQRIEEFKGKHVKSKKVKNVKRDATGLKGRVFVNQQDIKTKGAKFDTRGGSKHDALKRKRQGAGKAKGDKPRKVRKE